VYTYIYIYIYTQLLSLVGLAAGLIWDVFFSKDVCRKMVHVVTLRLFVENADNCKFGFRIDQILI